MSKEMSYDCINHIYTFLPYYEFCSIRTLHPYFKNIHSMPKMKSIIKREKAYNIIKTFMRQYISKSIARRKFIRKLLIDTTFREKNIYIHRDPVAHVCIKEWTPYLSKIILHNIIVFRKSIAQKTFDKISEVLENIPENQWGDYLKNMLID